MKLWIAVAQHDDHEVGVEIATSKKSKADAIAKLKANLEGQFSDYDDGTFTLDEFMDNYEISTHEEEV